MKSRLLAAAGLAWAMLPLASTAAAQDLLDKETGVLSYSAGFFAQARPATALDMIELLPGFTLDTGDAKRGLRGSRGNVRIDGQEQVSKTESVKNALARIPAEQVLRIELYYPGSSLLPAEGATMIANVVRDPSPARSATVVAEANGQDGGGGASLRIEGLSRSPARSAEGSGRVYFDRRRHDGDYAFVPVRGTALNGDMVESSRDRGQQARGELTFFLSEMAEARLGISANNDSGRYGVRVRLDGAAADQENYRSVYDTQKVEITGAYSRELMDGVKLSATFLQSLGWTDSDDGYDYEGFAFQYGYDGQSAETVARAVGTKELSKRLTLEAGAEGAYNLLDASSTYLESGQTVTLPAQDVRVSEWRGEAFARAQGSAGDHWSFDAGLALEASALRQSGDRGRKDTFHNVRPDIAVTYTLSRKARLSLSATRRVSQLDFSDFVTSVALRERLVEIGAPALEPERRWRFEAAYNLVFWDEGALGLYLTHEVIDNPQEFIPLAGLDAPGNLGEARRDTIYATVTAPLDRVGLTGAKLTGALTLVRSEVKDPVTGLKRELGGEVGSSGSLAFRQDLPARRLSWGLDVQASSEIRSYRLREVRDYEARPSIGADVEYRPASDLTVTLRAETSSVYSRSLRTVYQGSRAGGPVTFVERRSSKPGPAVYLTLRRKL